MSIHVMIKISKNHSIYIYNHRKNIYNNCNKYNYNNKYDRIQTTYLNKLQKFSNFFCLFFHNANILKF